ncbi:hypothetical protein IP88_08470 [alpha proteobacterium AAP81b]|nr:hypothetical protein IP88_08470 [alpha proteobacterium AAP81b]
MSFLNPSVVDKRRRRLKVGGLALLITSIIVVAFLVESRWGYSPVTVKLIYVQNWKGDRTREDAIADTRAAQQARAAKLAESRAFIASLTGKAKIEAQKQYDAYVAGGGAARDIPYAPAEPAVQ